MTETIKTKKAAELAGYLTTEKWESEWRIPRIDAVGLLVKGKRFFNKEETEELVSKTQAKQLGLVVPEGTEPATWRNWQVGRGRKWIEVDLFRVSSLKRANEVKVAVPKPARARKISPRLSDIEKHGYRTTQHWEELLRVPRVDAIGIELSGVWYFTENETDSLKDAKTRRRVELFTVEQWAAKLRIPKRQQLGVILNGKEYFWQHQTEMLLPRTKKNRKLVDSLNLQSAATVTVKLTATKSEARASYRESDFPQ